MDEGFDGSFEDVAKSNGWWVVRKNGVGQSQGRLSSAVSVCGFDGSFEDVAKSSSQATRLKDFVVMSLNAISHSQPACLCLAVNGMGDVCDCREWQAQPRIDGEDFETPSDQDDTVAGRLTPGEVWSSVDLCH